ncbi:MAG: squalene/phytoene synthase family protein [Verrucomicrobia bacterium]|nr:squalene/phytoene synthase family protein [Verrucomicrobiota bacterium]
MATTAATRKIASPAQITRAAKSNIAFSLLCLPAERREDMFAFYAYCRVVDDIADNPDATREAKLVELNGWRDVLNGIQAPVTEVERATIRVRDKYDIPNEVFLELIEGMLMDLDLVRYETWNRLKQYCYRVASVVGIACVTIFGYRNRKCLDYAVNLGYALQIVNIMRDVHEDFVNDNRIYIPQEDLEAAGYTEDDIANKRYDDAFYRLMNQQYARAMFYFEEAERGIPPEDRTNMLSGLTMSRIYYGILRKMKKDNFRIYDKRYSLTQPEKLLLLGRAFAARWIVG